MAWAAWPDSYPHRIEALEAIRYDMLSPEIPYDPKEVGRRYKAACEMGYTKVCKWKSWQTPQGGNPQLAVETFQKKCASKEPLACVILGLAGGTVNGRISEGGPDTLAAYRQFKFACKKKAYGPGCTHLGEMVLNGIETKRDPAQALDLFEEACKAKDGWGCDRLAHLYLAGEAVERDTAVAEKLFYKSCRQGYEQSCVEYAELLHDRSERERDLKTIAKHFSMACQWGSIDHCVTIAGMYAEGRGFRRSLATAKGLYQMACGQDIASGCYGVAEIYMAGDEAGPDPDEASSYFLRACQGEHFAGCSKYGQMLLETKAGRKDPTKALKFMQRGCIGGDPLGCIAIADGYRTGKGLEKNLDRAEEIYKETCDAGFGRACFSLAQLSEARSAWGGANPDPIYKKACDLGDGRGCGEMARKAKAAGASAWDVQILLEQGCEGRDAQACSELAKGYWDQHKKEEGLELWSRACQISDNDACIRAAEIHKSGEMGEPSLSKAAALYDRACDRDDERACKAGEPIAFQGRFDEVVEDGFQAWMCQLWAQDPDDSEEVIPIADVHGAQIRPFIGLYRGNNISIWPIRTEFESGKLHEGRSIWSVGSQESGEAGLWGAGEEGKEGEEAPAANPWGIVEEAESPASGEATASVWSNTETGWSMELTHYETWDPKQGTVARVFPGEYSQVRGLGGELRFSRETEQVEITSRNCSFAVPAPYLQADHCTELQALLAAYTVMECQ
jgi:uncharacterized protein